MHLLTGEYPPAPGGVGDYTAILAAGLAAAGVRVHVWTSGDAGEEAGGDGVTVHRVAGRWAPTDLARLGRALDAFAPPRRLIVEYAPHQWGYKGLNFGFGIWLGRRRSRGDVVRVMFHEVRYTIHPGDGPRRWLLAAGQWALARQMLGAADRVDVAIPRWEGMLRPSDPRPGRPMTWRPVLSNVPRVDDPEGVAAVRRRFAPAGGLLIGSFGTFARLIAGPLAAALRPLLDGRPDRAALLVGRGSEAFGAAMRADGPGLTDRLVAAGALPAEQVSLHLQACDLLIQPFPDGVCTRRSTLMAGLAQGVAILTNTGPSSEPFWAEAGCVALSPGDDAAAMARAAEALLVDPSARARLGAAARRVFDERFSVGRLVADLLRDLDGAPGTSDRIAQVPS